MSTNKPDTAASLWGAGAGTGFVGLLQVIPDAFTHYEAMLTFCAPALTVGFAASWLLVGNWWSERKLKVSVRKAKDHRDRVLSDRHASNGMKARARENYEELAQLLNDFDCGEGRAVGVSLTSGGTTNGPGATA